MTPDGGKVVFTRSTSSGLAQYSSIYIMNSDGTGVTALTTNGGYRETATGISPDGSRIVFASARDQAPGVIVTSDIYTMRTDGSDVQRLTDSAATFDTDPCFAPDGRIYWLARTEVTGEATLYRMNGDGTGKTALPATGQFYYPTISPNGQQILVMRTDGLTTRLVCLGIDGAGATELLNLPMANACYSPDGSKIIYVANPANTGPNLYLADSLGANGTRLTTLGNVSSVGNWVL